MPTDKPRVPVTVVTLVDPETVTQSERVIDVDDMKATVAESDEVAGLVIVMMVLMAADVVSEVLVSILSSLLIVQVPPSLLASVVSVAILSSLLMVQVPVPPVRLHPDKMTVVVPKVVDLTSSRVPDVVEAIVRVVDDTPPVPATNTVFHEHSEIVTVLLEYVKVMPLISAPLVSDSMLSVVEDTPPVSPKKEPVTVAAVFNALDVVDVAMVPAEIDKPTKGEVPAVLKSTSVEGYVVVPIFVTTVSENNINL